MEKVMRMKTKVEMIARKISTQSMLQVNMEKVK